MATCRTLEETFEKESGQISLCGTPVYAIWDEGDTVWDAVGSVPQSFWDLSGQYGIITISRTGNIWTEKWD